MVASIVRDVEVRTPGRHRITTRAEYPAHVVRYDTPKARLMGGLTSIVVDLTFVSDACRRAVPVLRDKDQRGFARDQVTLEAYWCAAIVTYARCFDSPQRILLTEQDAEDVGLLAEHRRFMDRRNLHIAHHIDPHWQQAKIGLHLAPLDSDSKSVLGASCMIVQAMAGSEQEIEQLIGLALTLRDVVQTRLDVASNEVLEEARAAQLDDLYALPATDSAPVQTTAMTSKPRKRKR